MEETQSSRKSARWFVVDFSVIAALIAGLTLLFAAVSASPRTMGAEIKYDLICGLAYGLLRAFFRADLRSQRLLVVAVSAAAWLTGGVLARLVLLR